MNRAAIALISMTALVAACQRGSDEPLASRSTAPDTRSMGAASAPSRAASSPAARPASALAPGQAGTVTTPANEDVSAGRTIATQGAPGAAACASCHGANGEGNPQSGFPRIAGQGRFYIEHQLNSYADGTRANPVMTPIAGALSAQQRKQVAAYFAGTGNTNTAAKTNATAPVLAVRGDDKRGIQACVNCHGPQGIGDAAANPYLAGQNTQYLATAMGEWKSGVRHNDPSGQMPAIAKALNDDEVNALIAYYSALPAPAPRNTQAAAVAVNTSRPAVQSGPVSPTTPAQGSGTQQGSALTGGAQGQGSGGAATNQQQSGNK